MVKSVSRALNLLKEVGESDKGVSINELSQKTNLAPSTIHRLLHTLKVEGFIEQEEESNNYFLGHEILILGLKVKGKKDLRKLAITILKELTEITEEDSYLTIPYGNSGVFLESIKGPHPLKVIETFGEEIPLHCGAMRKVLLAYKNKEFIENYFKSDLKKYNINTITNKLRLLEELEEIRKQGYATSFEEYTSSGAGVAVPVRDNLGNVIASIGIIGPISRFGTSKLNFFVTELRNKGDKLSRLMGYIEPVEF